MSVIGFDIGNENCVIAVAKQRGIDVILNDESNRETPAVVSFGEKQRFLGVAGAASATMNPKSTVSQIKRLIGRKYREISVQEDLRLLPFETSEAPDGGVLIDLEYLGEREGFKPVQVLGMLIAHLRGIVEKDSGLGVGVGVRDCVIGVPSYFTEAQRRGYLEAAEIGGLRVLRLMHDCTATALGYGIYKNDFQSGVTNVVFVDVGHCDTQVSVVAFEAGCMKVLAHGFDSNLGGRDFDEVLVRYFAGKFKEEYNIDVYSSARAIVRLRAACEKLKKVLSANPEAPLNIECLMEEKDVKGFIKRDDFESLSSELLERISIPCRQALLDSGLTVENIHTIELVGSGSRVPAMTKIISSLFRKEPSRTINASECVARGCALQCAMLSPTFRVRDYEVEDSFPYSIGFAFEEGPVCTLPNGMLFPKGHPFPSIKMLSLNRSSTFQMEAYYAKENELPPGAPTKISMFTIGPFPASHAEKVKVKVRVQLNLHGIVTVESASRIEDHADDSQVKDNASVYSEDMEPPNLEALSSGNNMHSSSVFQKPIRRLDIHITENVNGAMTADEFSLAKEKELQLVQQDVNMEQTKELKNTLESYVYDTRNKLLNTYRSFASDPERDGISFNLQQTEEWLYDDGYDESKNVYAEKLEDLKKMVDPVKQRYHDEEARAEATRNLLNNITEYRMAAGSCSHNEKEAVNSECKKAEQWIREKSQQQDSLPKHADPVLWSGEIKRKTEALDAMCKHIMRSKSSSTKPEDGADGEDNMRVD